MSPSREDDDLALDAATLRALRDADQLLPVSEPEVARAERALDQQPVELPERLRRYRAPEPTSSPPPLRWRPAATHAVAATIGALAAGFALYGLRPTPEPPVTSAGGELVPSARRSHTPRVPLVFKSRCESECCAGSECRGASEALRSCPSGARCIGCGTDHVHGGPYRLRLGTVVPSAAGQRLLPLDAPLELCVSAAGRAAQCLPALIDAGGESWRLLAQVTSAQDLLDGLSFELRKRGDAAALASWKYPVSPSPDVMCKGLAIQLGDATEILARVSVFVEQTHFVELARAATVPPLLAALARFDVSGIEAQVFETSSPGAGRFALMLGPIDRGEADHLRWQALDHGVEAKLSHGLDTVGKPRPSR